ncbi:hypothetical protein FACS1894137_04240 [Spirochaetia bacterium]|nr:hypothetical protein FACS1894137_04240 [Spirochaetia bacterium]
MFSLSRMGNAALTETAFTLPADYDYCSHADGSYFGVFHGKEKKHFRVAFFAILSPDFSLLFAVYKLLVLSYYMTTGGQHGYESQTGATHRDKGY